MATEEISVAALPDDGLAAVLGVLPPKSLAVARCVCKAWRDIIDGRALLRQHLLPRSLRGFFINYIDHNRTHLFVRPTSSLTFPKIDGLLSFLPNDPERDWWNVLDHCNGLLLCNVQWESQLLVCNPATQRWTLLPGKFLRRRGEICAYIAFDPTVSPQYEVLLIPDLPEKPEPQKKPKPAEKAKPAALVHDALFCLEWLFSLPEGALSVDEDDQMVIGQGALSSDDEDDQTDQGQGALSIDDDGEDQTDNGQDTLSIDDTTDDDPCRLMEWPPSQWSLKVFSSSTGLWEDRLFVREGPPAGTVEDMRLDPRLGISPRQRYAVYQNGWLYVHCRGSFLARFSLSMGKYQVIKMTMETKGVTPYLGRCMNAIYFGTIVADGGQQLQVWKLNESCGHMEWLLKYDADIRLYADHVASSSFNGSWMVEEATHAEGDGDCNAETESHEESIEWDSDKDDIFMVDEEAPYSGRFEILGFHPYKEVVFLAEPFEVVSYHFTNPTKIQHLGYSRPKCYYQNHSNGIYESFIYTPCMIGDLLHGGDNGE